MLVWFVETSLVAAALAGLAALATKSGRLGPASRHALWLVVLLKMIMPPVFHWPRSEPQAVSEAVVVAQFRPPAEPAIALDELSPFDEAGYADLPPFPEDEASLGVTAELKPIEIDEVASESLATQWGAVIANLVAKSSRPLMLTWMGGMLAFAVWQTGGILRFGWRLRRSKPAPDWLLDEVIDEAARFGVRPPPVKVVDWPGSPFLWCGGRSVLVIPHALLCKLERERWRGILAHEMAHLRRGDPWTCRLVLAAGVMWWWSPLYWLVRSRLAAEAELASDALTVSAAPEARRAFAEALVSVCEAISVRPAAPSLGVGGEGRFLERRLTMILKGRDSGRLSRHGLLAAVLMSAISAPSWSRAQDEPAKAPETPAIPAVPAAPAPPAAPADVAAPPAPPQPPALPLPPAVDEDSDDMVIVRHVTEDGKVITEERRGPVDRLQTHPADRARGEIERLEQLLRRMEDQQKRMMEQNETRMKALRDQLKQKAEQLASQPRLETAPRATRNIDGDPVAAQERDAPRPQAEPRAARSADARPEPRPRAAAPRARSMDRLAPRSPDEERVVGLSRGIEIRRGEPRGEIDALNRRIDGLEKKLDLLLDALRKEKSGKDKAELNSEIQEIVIEAQLDEAKP